MKKILTLLIIIVSAASLYAEASWNINTGINYTGGLLYNSSWDPAYNGNALTVTLSRENESLLLEGGMEAGFNYTGVNLLFPLRAGVELTGNDTLMLSALTSVMPGMIMSRPTPYFLFAAELAARLRWQITPGFSLAMTLGPRYTTSPGYSSAIAELSMIDLTLGFSTGFTVAD